MGLLRPVILLTSALVKAFSTNLAFGTGKLAGTPRIVLLIIEVCSDFYYISIMAESEAVARKGARRMSDVPPEVLALLTLGQSETVNLMEWLAADMSALALAVAAELPPGALADGLRRVAPAVASATITKRLLALGSAISASGVPLDGPEFAALAAHRSDLVRQWACYAVSVRYGERPIEEQLRWTLPFASDSNMSVREAAWMAFRPRLSAELGKGLGLLEKVAKDRDPNRRRFAVEVSRPRSVWGSHIAALKTDPSLAASILRAVRQDPSRYVQLAAGNWLNDASKTSPEWVLQLCEGWLADSPEASTRHIIRRALRTLRARRAASAARLPFMWPEILEAA